MTANNIQNLYRSMKRIRAFEEELVELVGRGEIPGPTHEYTGQEAVAVGVCASLRTDDKITSTHRGHGHLIAKGASIPRMFAELAGRATGLNSGRGGSMHAADLSLGILGANGIVGAGAAIACGAAWAGTQLGRDSVVVTFFGDGALSQGVLLEAMNLAALWKLPVIFACENNGFAVSLRVEDALAGDTLDRAKGFGMPAVRVDGMDVEAVASATAGAVARARAGDGPTFMDFITYRYVGHNTGERYLGVNYRSQDEIDSWRPKDPIAQAGAVIDEADRDRIDNEVAAEIQAGVQFALDSPLPDPAGAMNFMYAESPIRGALA